MATDASSKQRMREDLRMAVLEYLADRTPLEFDAETVLRHVLSRRREIENPELADVDAALSFLGSLGLAKFRPHPLGATRSWGATAKGTLARERGELPISN
jgi:hypothetical protein